MLSVVGGAVVHSSGCLARVDRFGVEHLGSPARFTEHTVIPVGSISKTVTAAVVTALEQRGRLRGSDSIHRFLPELDADPNVTIEDLLRQRTALVDYNDPVFLSDLGLPGALSAGAARARVLAAIGRGRVRRGPFGYNNSNYLILGTIAERAANAPFEALVAGLDPGAGRLAAPEGALPESYVPDVGAFRESPRGDARVLGGAGGVRSSAATLAHLWSALFGRTGSLRTLGAAMRAPSGDSGARSRYARGVIVDRTGGDEVVWHDGFIEGFSSYAEYRPRGDRVGVIVANTRLDTIQPAATEILALARRSPTSRWCA